MPLSMNDRVRIASSGKEQSRARNEGRAVTRFEIGNSRTGLVALVAILAGCLAAACGGAQSAPDQSGVLDYLVQDVCVDPAGRPTGDDPAVCPQRRNIRLGERLPYIVTDFDHQTGISHVSLSSVPVRSTQGDIMVLVVKSLEGRFTPDYRFSFSAARDAFDLIETSQSQYASIIRTFDGSCFDQIFASNPRGKTRADRAGGWVLFPRSPAPDAWPQSQSMRLTTWRKQVKPNGPRCGDNHATGVTVWVRPTQYAFESRKLLTALRSDHFAIADLSQPENSFERFYFTREYGMTRWESWWTKAHCHKTLGSTSPRCDPRAPGNPLRGRCSILTLPDEPVAGLTRRGGQDWVRMDCRDVSHHVELRRPQLPLSPEIGRGGGLLDVDYAATTGQ